MGADRRLERRAALCRAYVLEELRRRLFWIVGALVVATGVGLFVVLTFPVIRLLEVPIRAYLPSHKLAFTHPTEPFDISLHTAFAFGIALSFPVVIQQIWGFVRPALTRREKRFTVVAIGGSVLLFLAGAGGGAVRVGQLHPSPHEIGSATLNSVLPGRDSNSSRPLFDSTSRRAMSRPMPVP
jgi:hypothetical protein